MPRLFSIKPGITLRGRKFKGIRGFAGKPFHPPLTDIPVACYVLVAVFDVVSYVAYERDPASTIAHDFFVSGTHVIIAGAIVSVPTIITGFWDWLRSTPRHTQAWRTANWHMAVMLTMSILVAFDILARLAGWEGGTSDLVVTILSVVIGILVVFGAAYGGSMVYDYAFNVESDFDHAYAKSDRDRLPGQKGAEDEGADQEQV